MYGQLSQSLLMEVAKLWRTSALHPVHSTGPQSLNTFTGATDQALLQRTVRYLPAARKNKLGEVHARPDGSHVASTNNIETSMGTYNAHILVH
jgi:hypothetical protein